jgi:MFS family permease
VTGRAGAGLLGGNPAFRALWTARVLSLVGDGVAAVALLLHVEGRQGSGVAVGGLLLAEGLPRMLGPVAGALADRVDQRRLMVACDLGQAAVFAVVAALLPPYPVLLGLVAAAATLATAFTPAGRSAVPALVRREQLTEANAWLGTALNLRVALGPPLGGALVALVGTRAGLAVNACSFVASAAFLARVPALPPEPAPTGEPVRGLWATTAVGLAYTARHPTARTVVLALFFGVAFAGMDNVALVFLARRDLGAGPLGFGILAGAYGVGMTLASTALLRLGARAGPAGTFVAGLAATAAGLVLTGVAPTLAAAVACQALAGAGNGLENVAADTLVQRGVPRPLLGRVFGAVTTASFLGASLASVAGGVLLDLTSPRLVFLTAGVGVGSVVAVLLLVPAALSRPPTNG